jgi:hypothetical protein
MIFKLSCLRIYTIIFNTPEWKGTAFKEAMAIISESLRAQHSWLFSHHINPPPCSSEW